MTSKKQDELKRLKPIIVKILKRNGIKRTGIFGSYVKSEHKKNSDIDILVEIPKNKKFNLLNFAGLKLELQDNLRKKVDLVEYKMIKPVIKQKILNEEVRII